ncbi:cartilage matrix protein-like [Pecten maximus]|uniref:cartilage matrix protein-like n=1 Tax=Pecten maximus TaxID=6579 RepID=UPI0014586572|nr:cartilage matrix protein-like [Pecten maximus]
MEWLLCGVLALLAIKSTVGVDIDKKCYADIAFVVDSSSSIHESDFKIQKAFIENLVRYFDVGPKDVQFAAVSFNSYVYDEFKFNTNADQASVIEDVDDIRYRAGLATRTYKAIERMRDFLFASNNGARDDAEHVGIILTDGTTNPGRIDGLSSNQGKAKTQEEAKSARNDNITLFAIGIGPKVNMAELNGIATDPDDKFVITVANYSELDKEGVKKALFNRVCSLVNIPAPIAPTTTPTIPQGEDPKRSMSG